MTEHVETTPVHVRVIEIKGLFRQYDHRISLRDEDRVTVIHGRNGVGKTAVLTLVAALFKGRYSLLTNYPFRMMRVEFSDGSYVEVRPSEHKTDDPWRRNDFRFDAVYAFSGETEKKLSLTTDLRREVEAFAAGLFSVEPVADDVWRDRSNGDYLTAEAVVERYPVYFRHLPDDQELRMLCKRIPLHFIEAQRLLKVNRDEQRARHRESPPVTSTVDEVAGQMMGFVEHADSAYRTTSTRLDDTLPARLFSAAPRTNALDKLNERAETLEKERARLRDMGLIADSKSQFDWSALDETRRAMFAVYLQDNEEKLAVFKELADRVEILRKIVNDKFAPKRIDIDKDAGYQVISHDGQPLDLSKLSSGEQHELVLLHNLLFRVEAGALVLIDEPELSLHVAWQNEFLEDLIRIAKMVGFDALIATHSPYIVGTREDLMERLGGPT